MFDCFNDSQNTIFLEEKMRDDEYRVYLRPITGDDAEDVVRWRNSASVKKFFIYQGTFTKEGQLEWIEKKVKSGEVIQFIIVERKSEKSIGCVFIKDLDQIHKKGEFGIFIGEEDARGKGYGREGLFLATRMLDSSMKAF